MVFAAIGTASLRPLQSRCMHNATTALLCVHVKSPNSISILQAVVTLPPYQRRHQSQSKSSRKQDGLARTEKPQAFFRQFVGRALAASLRNLAVSVSPRGIKSAYRDAPALTSMSIILLVLLSATSFVAIRAYVRTFYNPDISRYPEPVANTLRRAIYYTNYKPDPEMALKYYKKAMEQVEEVGLDPFSDEVLGIRIQVSHWLQKIHSYRAAIDVLESILQDCKKWVAVMEQAVQGGNVTGTTPGGISQSRAVAAPSPTKREALSAHFAKDGATQPVHAKTSSNEADAETETLWRKRQRLLAKAIGTAVKLGEVYADEHVLEPDKSHNHLLWAVETSLKEFHRRRVDGAKPGEQSWLSPTELGGMLESLGRDYERRSQFQLAVPLFFQALKLCEQPCHRAVIMNNLAAAFAQQPTLTRQTTELSDAIRQLSDQDGLPQTRHDCLEAALNWAQNAYAHGKDVRGDDRTAECDEACAAALCNWADVAAMMGKTDVAQAKYKQCLEMSANIQFPDGIKQAQAGMAKLTSTPATRI